MTRATVRHSKTIREWDEKMAAAKPLGRALIDGVREGILEADRFTMIATIAALMDENDMLKRGAGRSFPEDSWCEEG